MVASINVNLLVTVTFMLCLSSRHQQLMTEIGKKKEHLKLEKTCAT